jgi:hypothetical protein
MAVAVATTLTMAVPLFGLETPLVMVMQRA